MVSQGDKQVIKSAKRRNSREQKMKNLKLIETRTVHNFCKTKIVVLFWENEHTRPRLIVLAKIYHLSAPLSKKTRDVAFSHQS